MVYGVPMLTADVQVLEAHPPKKVDGKIVRQPPNQLGRFRVQAERVDDLRTQARDKAHAFLKGRPFGVNFGEFDRARKQYTVYVTCKVGK